MNRLLSLLTILIIGSSSLALAFEPNCAFTLDGTAYKKNQSFSNFLVAKGGSKMSGHGKWRYNNVGDLAGFKLWSVQVMPFGTTETQCRTGCSGGFASAVKSFVSKHSTCSMRIQKTNINQDYHLRVGSTSAKVSAPHANGVTCTCERQVIANTVEESCDSFFRAVGSAGGIPTKKRRSYVNNSGRSSGKETNGSSRLARNTNRRSGRQ